MFLNSTYDVENKIGLEVCLISQVTLIIGSFLSF